MSFGTVHEIIGKGIRTGAFFPYSAPGGRGVAASPWPEDLPLPAEAARFFTGTNARRAKESRKVEAVICEKWFLKRYRYRGIIEAVKDLFRPGRPEKVLAATLKLTQAGLHLPAVILAGRTESGLKADRLLITQALPPEARPWDKMAESLLAEEALTAFIQKSVAALVRMHGCGIAHGDLNLRNLYQWDGELWFIDLDGATFCRTGKALPRRCREKELARLVSSLFRAWKYFHHDTPPELRAAITARFVKEYQKQSGMALGGAYLTGRIEYLTSRVRKDGKDAYIRNVETIHHEQK